MKTIIKKHPYILLLINLLFLTACNKADNDDNPEPIDQDVPELIDQIACRLTNETDLENNSSRDFEYNVNGYLIKETKVYQYAGSTQTLVTTYTYDSKNSLIKYGTTRNNQYDGHRMYEYDNGKISLEKIYYADRRLGNTITYVYGANDKLIKTIQSNGDTHEFTYDVNENVILIELYNYLGSLLSKHMYHNYDDKTNYLLTLKGNQGIGTLSKNNLGRMEVEFYQNGEVGYRYNMNYFYKYNSKGFPVEITYTNENKNFSKTFSYICN